MMKNKPNDRQRLMINNNRRRNLHQEFIMHRHCEHSKHSEQQEFAHSLVNHSRSFRTLGTILISSVLLLFIPTIVKCDKTILNEIDNGGDVQKSTLTDLSVQSGRLIGEKWLRQTESPYLLQTDLTIERTGKLFIEPGVTVHVAPMVGITVKGVLAALVRVNVNTK